MSDFYNKQDQSLRHFGVLGMKWGHRRARREFGMSKYKLKKQIKNAADTSQNKVERQYFKELNKNKQYNTLGKQSNKQYAIVKNYNNSKRSLTDTKMPKKVQSAYNKLRSIDRKMTNIEREVGKKYTEKFNKALLNDIKYKKSIDVGMKMLNQYQKRLLYEI